jgi:hypothetical protein
MKSEPYDLLLGDALVDDTFRTETLLQTLRLARRRRHVRVARRGVALAMLLAVIAFLLHPSVPAPQPLASAAPSFIVHTTRLTGSQVVHTRAELFSRVASAPASLTAIATVPDAFVAVETRTASPKLERLSDRQLLATFADEHPALIAAGTEEARLVFH